MDSASPVKAEILQSCLSGKNFLFPCCLVAPWVPLELHVLSAGVCFPRQSCLALLKWLWFAGTEWNGHDVLSVKKNYPSPGHQGVFELPAAPLPYPESEGIQNEGHKCLEGS